MLNFNHIFIFIAFERNKIVSFLLCFKLKPVHRSPCATYRNFYLDEIKQWCVTLDKSGTFVANILFATTENAFCTSFLVSVGHGYTYTEAFPIFHICKNLT